MNARETLDAARVLWLRTSDQLFLEVDALTERVGDMVSGQPLAAQTLTGGVAARSVSASQDPAPAATYGSADALEQASTCEREPGPETHLVGVSDGGVLPCAVPFPDVADGASEGRAPASISNSTASTRSTSRPSAGGGVRR